MIKSPAGLGLLFSVLRYSEELFVACCQVSGMTMMSCALRRRYIKQLFFLMLSSQILVQKIEQMGQYRVQNIGTKASLVSLLSEQIILYGNTIKSNSRTI